MDWRPLANSIAQWVQRIALDPGELAELRRTGLQGAFSVPFLKLMVAVVEPFFPPPPTQEHRERYYRNFATIARSAALLSSMHHESGSLGAALAKTVYSEHRLLRLLRAKGDILEQEIGACSLWLSRHEGEGVRINLADILALVLEQDTKHAEDVRLKIARDYFRDIGQIDSGIGPDEQAFAQV